MSFLAPWHEPVVQVPKIWLFPGKPGGPGSNPGGQQWEKPEEPPGSNPTKKKFATEKIPRNTAGRARTLGVSNEKGSGTPGLKSRKNRKNSAAGKISSRGPRTPRGPRFLDRNKHGMSSREQQWTQSKNADPAAARAVAARWAGPLCAAAPVRARGDCRVHAPGGPGAAALEKRKTCQKWKLGKALNRGSRGPGPPRRGGTGHGCRVHCGCAAKRDTAGVAYGAGNEFRQVLTW